MGPVASSRETQSREVTVLRTTHDSVSLRHPHCGTHGGGPHEGCWGVDYSRFPTKNIYEAPTRVRDMSSMASNPVDPRRLTAALNVTLRLPLYIRGISSTKVFRRRIYTMFMNYQLTLVPQEWKTFPTFMVD